MEIDHLTYPERAAEFLSESLSAGTLVLFLGAGASASAGLPNWRSLIESIRTHVGMSNATLDSSADSLQRAVDEVRREHFDGNEKGFAELVRECLYNGVTLDDSLLPNHLLISLGALMMGSRRGSVKRVVTFNFDSVLESYISIYGFVPRVVLQPPVDEGAEDVRIYHPHGFLPHPALGADSSDFVILGLKSINLRLGKRNDDWIELLRHILTTGIGLFIGLSEHSFRDRALAPLLADVAETLKRRRPTGVWVLVSEPGDRDQLTKEFLDLGVVPLHLSTYEEIPKFLLNVCQRSAGSIRVSG
jgi:hypothetical protein